MPKRARDAIIKNRRPSRQMRIGDYVKDEDSKKHRNKAS